MPDYPPGALQAAAEVLFRQYESEYSAVHLTWQDFADPAREVLDAAWPHLATVTAWGVRPDPQYPDKVKETGSDEEAGKIARMLATDYAKSGLNPRALVRRTVTYGPWETVPDE